MSKFYPNLLHLRWLILFCCLLAIVGCSHTSPYYSPLLPETVKGKAVEDEIKPDAALRYRVILLGDGGAPQDGEPVLRTLDEWARKVPQKTSIIFLGDNLYPDGLTKDRRAYAYTRLGPQIVVVKSSGAHGLFIPGNHDWAKEGAIECGVLNAQEKFINDTLGSQSNYLSKQETEAAQEVFLPKDGSPGPVNLDLPLSKPAVRLIVLDTQWWLREYKKDSKTPESVIDDLKALLITELPVVVVGHHPLETYGRHGGFRDWQAHLFALRDWKSWLWFPTPIVGSLYHLIDWHLCKSDQDINGERNKNMVKHLNNVFSIPNKTPFLIYASGHDHSLQVLKGSNTDYLLVSGAAASKKVSEVTHGSNTLFAHARTGFMVVDFLANDKVYLRVVGPGDTNVRFSFWLKSK